MYTPTPAGDPSEIHDPPPSVLRYTRPVPPWAPCGAAATSSPVGLIGLMTMLPYRLSFNRHCPRSWGKSSPAVSRLPVAPLPDPLWSLPGSCTRTKSVGLPNVPLPTGVPVLLASRYW